MGSKVERQLGIIQELAHIGSWDWDVATDVVTWSDELYRIYGLPPRSHGITLDVHLSSVHPDDRERVAAEVHTAIRTRRRFALRERIVRPDGSVRELDTVGEVVVGPDRIPTGLLGICRDITDELRQTEHLRMCAEVVDNLQIGLSVWRLDDTPDGPALRLVGANLANERMTAISTASSIGRTLQACFPAAVGSELPRLMLGVDGLTHPRGELATCRLPKLPGAPVFAVKAFALPDRCVGIALEDVTARVHAHRLQFAESRALEMLAAGERLDDILAAIVAVIEELVPDTLASILVVDETGTRLRHAASATLPRAYTRAIDGAQIGPAAGSCGTAAYRRDAVFVTDIETDPLWEDYRAIARPFGLRACWSSPILANDGHVLGTFAMYYRTPRRPEPEAIELIARAAHVAGIAIERRHLDAQLSALSARVEAAREDERTGIAREIHDVFGQALTALKLDIAWVARRKPDEPAILDKLQEMSAAADELISAVQRIVRASPGHPRRRRPAGGD